METTYALSDGNIDTVKAERLHCHSNITKNIPAVFHFRRREAIARSIAVSRGFSEPRCRTSCWLKHINTSTSRRVQRHDDASTTHAQSWRSVITLDIVTHQWGPARHPRYTHVHHGGEAVGGSTYTARTRARRAPSHNTSPLQKTL